VDYTNLIKRIVLPAGFVAPVTLRFEDIVATALSREYLSEDVAGINASLDLITRTRGGGWPTEPVTEDGNYIDLVWHECEFRDGYSFSYAVHTDKGEYLGCCYFYPMGKRTPLSEEMARRDVDVSWWVTPSTYGRGYYEKLFRALGHWGTRDFPFAALHFSNKLIPS
jgi:RimJ/RimL family protein N-acetyltransferase